MSVTNSNSTPIAPASIMSDDQSAAIPTLGPLDQPPQTPLIPSKRDYDTESNDPTRRSKRTKPDGTPTTGDTLSTLPFAQHNNRIYHPGDHAIFDDLENTTGTHGTPFAAVGQIHQLEQQPASGAVLVTVNWYVHPQFTSHPPTMEFYRMAVLRTFRQTVVPLERIRSACFVVPPADLMVGRPGEWREGDALFVCESRYVDKGEFIQKVKQWGKGFWPEGMSEERKAMLMTMVPWPAGPRVLERSVIPSDNVLGANPGEPSAEDAGKTPQQNRRVTRMSATPQQPQVQPQMIMQTPTSVPHQAQIPGFPPMMPQGRMSMGITNGQPQPPPPQFVLNQFQQQQHQLQMQIQMQRQMTANPPYMQTPMSPSTNTNVPVASSAAAPSVPVTPLPRRRGRPPKNKQLIEKRAMEDAAAAAAGLGRTPPKPPTVSTRRQASMVTPYQNNGRPPLSQIQQQQQQFQHQQHQRLNGFVGAGDSVNGGQRAMPMMQGNMNQTQAYAIRNPNGNNTGQTPLQQHQQQQLRQQQQQQVKKIAPLPYIDPTSVPQLSKEIVDLFPTVNGKIKWFATAPVCQKTVGTVCHSEAYLKWVRNKQQQNNMDIES